MANGQIVVLKQLGRNLLVRCSAIKPGHRFVDETSTMHLSEEHGLRLTGSKNLELFEAKSKAAQAEKKIAEQSTFKVELSDRDKERRDAQKTTVYHTGQGVDINNWAAPQEKKLTN